MKTLFLIRGLPGIGKTTLANILAPFANASNDMYFEDEKTGTYNYDPSKMKNAVHMCMITTRILMEVRKDSIAVHNTFTCYWEMHEYFELAEQYGYTVQVIDLNWGQYTLEELAERNTHSVPIDVIQRMRDRYELDINLTRANYLRAHR